MTVAKPDRRTSDERFRRDLGVHARFQPVFASSPAAERRHPRGARVGLRERFGGGLTSTA